MKVIDLMTRKPKLIGPDDSLQTAAHTMRKSGAGVLPVISGAGKLIGMLTDRDITTRATARGTVPAMRVREAMTNNVVYGYEDEDILSAGKRMLKNNVGRLPVLNKELKLAGIVSLADILTKRGGKKLVKGSVLGGLLRPQIVVPVLLGCAIAGYIAANKRRKAQREQDVSSPSHAQGERTMGKKAHIL